MHITGANNEFHLRQFGGGADGKGMCVMELVSWYDGEPDVSDHPASACTALRTYAIMLNDSARNPAARDTLAFLAPVLSGSRNADLVQRRAEHLVRETAARVVAWADLHAAGALMRMCDEGMGASDMETQVLVQAAVTAARPVIEHGVPVNGEEPHEPPSADELWSEMRAILVEALLLDGRDETGALAAALNRTPALA